MGASKDRWMRQKEQGFTSRDGYVCPECIGDPDLSNFIKSNGKQDECSYCHVATQTIEFDELMDRIIFCIKTEYTQADNELGRDDGDWVTLDGNPIEDSYDIITENLDINSDDLKKDILSSIEHQQWCEINYYGLSPIAAFLSGWERFVDRILHKNRYTFCIKKDEYTENYEPEGISTQDFLRSLTCIFENAGLYSEIPVGTKLYRVRTHDKSQTLITAADLGTPPISAAKYSNRMSPAGIPMFYCSEIPKTSIKEVFDHTKPGIITIGEFSTIKQLNVVDLTKIPAIPSVFSGDARHIRHSISFLKKFANDISLPCPKDSKEKIEYIPTQIITEYIRYQHEFGSAPKIDGVIYPSSKGVNERAMVLFIEDHECIDAKSKNEGKVQLNHSIREEDINVIIAMKK